MDYFIVNCLYFAVGICETGAVETVSFLGVPERQCRVSTIAAEFDFFHVGGGEFIKIKTVDRLKQRINNVLCYCLLCKILLRRTQIISVRINGGEKPCSACKTAR